MSQEERLRRASRDPDWGCCGSRLGQLPPNPGARCSHRDAAGLGGAVSAAAAVRSLACSLAGESEALPAPEPRGRHAQRPPPASAPPASGEQPRRAWAPTAGVVMAAAPAMTAALRGARAERASWRADGRTAHIPAGGGQGARAPTLTPAAPRSTGRGRRLPGSCPPKPRLPENTAPLLAVSLRAGGREGREGVRGRQQIENCLLAPSLPVSRQKLPNPALESATASPTPGSCPAVRVLHSAAPFPFGPATVPSRDRARMERFLLR